LSEIRAVFEAALWKDFSKEHRALREELESSLADYRAGKFRDPMAVWGAFGAGKTQFLFWVAEKALEIGLIPVYFHLNDLLDGVSGKPPPEGFRDHARVFVDRLVETLRSDPSNELLRKTYRDEALLSYILERLDEVDGLTTNVLYYWSMKSSSRPSGGTSVDGSVALQCRAKPRTTLSRAAHSHGR
jgi:hypothetical protein